MKRNIIVGILILIGVMLISAYSASIAKENNYIMGQEQPKFKEKYEVGGITFFFYNQTPMFCARGEASGCALPALKTIYMINHSYEGYEGLLQLCRHETCHIYEGYNTEDICVNTTNNYWECDNLVELIRSEN